MSLLRVARWIVGVPLMLIGFSVFLLGAFAPDGLTARLIGLGIGSALMALGILLTFYLDVRLKRSRRRQRLEKIGGKFRGDAILLDCVTKDSRGEWVMELYPERALLHWPEAGFTGQIPSPEAEAAIKLPGFGESRSQLIVELPGRPLTFRNPGADVRRVRRWLDVVLALTRPERLGEVRRGGLRDLAIGVGLILVGVLATWISFKAVERKGGTYFIFHGIALVGVVFAVKGISGLVRHRRLLRVIAEAEAAGLRLPLAVPPGLPDEDRPSPQPSA